MNCKNVAAAFEHISRIMDQNCDYLIQLDQQNGDGDLGVSMKAGFRAVKEYTTNTKESDLGKIFAGIAGTFNDAAPSSLGTILSIGFMGMAKELKGKEETTLQQTAKAMESGIKRIMERAHSKPGEKTILDALDPAVVKLKESASEEIECAYCEATEAAEKGSESTREMLPKHGRAAYYGEKSIGVLDGGSVVGKLIFEGIYRSVI